MFLSAKYGGELLIEMQFMVLRCVPHGVTLLSQQTPGQSGKVTFNWTDRQGEI
jgi:hypothetical protein